jgi:hypothetical protein
MSERRNRPYKGPERRARSRVDVPRPLTGELTLDLESEVLRLSSGGMMVQLPFPLAAGSRHKFTLVVEQDVIELAGVVRHCQPLEEASPGPAYGVGVEFEGLDETKQRVLESFVSRKLGR